MTPHTEEGQRLLRLARRDQAAFTALLHAPGVDFAIACFHAQQAAEKALKSVMFNFALEYRRTHDLEELASRLTQAGVPPPVPESALSRLTPYAVEFRYDDEATHLIDAPQATQMICDLLAWAEEEIRKSEANPST